MARIVLSSEEPFSLDQTLGCGQVFRWNRLPDGRLVRCCGRPGNPVPAERSTLTFKGADETFIRHYFSLDLDLGAILESIDVDPFIHRAIERCRGLRLVRQPPWECLCSYICATNSNIPMIRRRIASIAETFGDEVEPGESKFFSFPHPSKISCTGRSIGSRCLQARVPHTYVSGTSSEVAAQNDWATTIAAMPYEEARSQIMKFSGIGPKAADCVLLFAFQKYDAFPVDVWIRRMMKNSTISQHSTEIVH